jgi:hypothetical protein
MGMEAGTQVRRWAGADTDAYHNMMDWEKTLWSA